MNSSLQVFLDAYSFRGKNQANLCLEVLNLLESHGCAQCVREAWVVGFSLRLHLLAGGMGRACRSAVNRPLPPVDDYPVQNEFSVDLDAPAVFVLF
jgi:hypothetical protein